MSVYAQAILTEFYVAKIVIGARPVFLGERVVHRSVVVAVRAINLTIVGIGRDGQAASVDLSHLFVAEAGAAMDSDLTLLTPLTEEEDARGVGLELVAWVALELADGELDLKVFFSRTVASFSHGKLCA